MSEPVDLRILQANERTLLAWVRTGLALMAFGFVIGRVVVELRQEEGQNSSLLWLGAGVMVVGTACQVIGAVRFVRARRSLLAGESPIPTALGPVVIATLVGLGGVALLAELILGR